MDIELNFFVKKEVFIKRNNMTRSLIMNL